MNVTAPLRQEFDIEHVEYLRHGDKPFLATLFKPRGNEPFPALVDIHGGAWCKEDRLRDSARHEAMARAGIAVAAIDYRVAEEGAYPLSQADVNYGVRWLKANPHLVKTRADLVGISGQSSGGHQAMLAAMRPHDPRYNAIPLPPGSAAVDATVACAVTCWPVINPVGRYRHAKRVSSAENPPKWPASAIVSHDRYWKTEAAMTEGSPMLMLERGEKVSLPPAIWIQSVGDPAHDYKDLDSNFPGTEAKRFAANYEKAGGEFELHYYDAPRRFTTIEAESPPALDAFQKMIDFVRKHVPVKA